MFLDVTFPSKTIYVSNIRAMFMDSADFAAYTVTRFPFELNNLTDIQYLYQSCVEIYHMRMPIKASGQKCLVLNALVACWPGSPEYHVAVIEFKSIQKALNIEPNIDQCKRLLLGLMKDKWGVIFKGKELVVC